MANNFSNCRNYFPPKVVAAAYTAYLFIPEKSIKHFMQKVYLHSSLGRGIAEELSEENQGIFINAVSGYFCLYFWYFVSFYQLIIFRDQININ